MATEESKWVVGMKFRSYAEFESARKDSLQGLVPVFTSIAANKWHLGTPRSKISKWVKRDA